MRSISRAGFKSGLATVAAVAITMVATSTTSHATTSMGDSASSNSSGSSLANNTTIPGAAPFRAPFADNSIHDHVTVESNPADLANWQRRFDGPGGEDNYEPTDLTFTKSSNFYYEVDVFWYVDHIAGDTAAYYDCLVWSSSTRCDSAMILIADDSDELSDILQNNLVCHELGHSVGFGHGTAAASCMTGGDNNLLAWWEIQTINAKY